MMVELQLATLDEIIGELVRRGFHGVVAIDDMQYAQNGSTETECGVALLGHPTAAVGMADLALRVARDSDDHRRGETEVKREN